MTSNQNNDGTLSEKIICIMRITQIGVVAEIVTVSVAFICDREKKVHNNAIVPKILRNHKERDPNTIILSLRIKAKITIKINVGAIRKKATAVHERLFPIILPQTAIIEKQKAEHNIYKYGNNDFIFYLIYVNIKEPFIYKFKRYDNMYYGVFFARRIYRFWKTIFNFLIVFSILTHFGCSIFFQQEGHFINNDVALHYIEKGKGPPVILIHGILANSNLNWRFPGIMQRLSKNYYVIAMDLRGHGKSDKPYGKEMYGTHLVNDVCKVMEDLNINKAHIVGYSLGGFIALKFATCYPEKVYSVTIAGAGWEKSTEENLKQLETIYTSMRENGDCTPLFELVGMRKKGLERISIAIGNWYFRKTNDLNVIADLLESVPELEVKQEDLIRCEVPILLIGGTSDPMCKTIPELSDTLPNNQVVWVNKGTHLTTLFKKGFIDSIENFLTNNK